MSVYAINPIEHPDAWSYITVAGIQSPGLAIQSDPGKLKYSIDVKTGRGTLGATETFTGTPPVPFAFTLQFWRPDHFEAWDSFLPLLKYDPTKTKLTAIDFYYPAIADLDVHSVVTAALGALTHKGGGLWEVKIGFLQYRPAPAKSAVATPTSAAVHTTGKTDAGGNTTPDALDQKQREIARLTKKWESP